MPKANNRNIYEERPWLNDDVQNRTVLRQIVGGGSDITVEEVTFTDNGDYTAPEGKAYSPVHVNVAGGSSDFSTAEGTFNLTFPEGITPDEIAITSYFNYNDKPYAAIEGIPFEDNKGTILLHEGVGYLGSIAAYVGDTEYIPVNNSIVVTGNIEIPAFGSPIVTGDFTYSCNMVESLP